MEIGERCGVVEARDPGRGSCGEGDESAGDGRAWPEGACNTFFLGGRWVLEPFGVLIGWFVEFVRVLVWGFGEAKMYEVKAWLGKTGGCT
jgi:hypothetical protein